MWRCDNILTIKELTADINQNAVNHGWWNESRSFGDIIALCHSELSEALEEYRAGKPEVYFMMDAYEDPAFGDYSQETDLELWNGTQKIKGTATEMADCIIRILDWAGKEGIDIESIIEMKHKYNKTRPYRHGNKKI